MYLKQLASLIFISSILCACSRQQVIETRQETDFNFNWRFSKENPNDNIAIVEFDDSKWEQVTLPHSPNIEPLVVNNQWRGICWYRKHFTVTEEMLSKKVFIEFEGAMQVADVWINGIHKITHFGGYLPFVIDVSDDIRTGDNVIAVKLNNEENLQVPPGKPLEVLDFNTYGGIYRNVKLLVTEKIYITDPVLTTKVASGGVFVRCDTANAEIATLSITTQVINEYPESAEITIQHILSNSKGSLSASYTSDIVQVSAGEFADVNAEMKVIMPELWHPEHPNLYTLKTIVIKGGEEIDAQENKIGLRNFKLERDGFYLNHEKYFINGTNRHQEYPYIGYALSDEAQYRDAVKIKNAGFDLVRLSHYPQSTAFLDACDELGLLVMNCIPGWQFMGDESFRINSLEDCRKLIRRDRNHTSIAFWEISLNETLMDTAYMNKANHILNEEMPSSALSAAWMDYPAYDLFIPARQHSSPPDYWNGYRPNERSVFIAEYGDWEYYAQNAGFNQIAYQNLKEEERTSRQFRGDGEKRLLQQVLNYQEAFNSNLKGPSTIGHANWLMFDYNRGYADDIEASGISDIFRIPKFAYYFYRSQRPPFKLDIEGIESGPMVFIASYWKPESATDVRVFSNCYEVELYLNDELVAKQTADTNKLTTDLLFPPFTFSLNKFTSGNLKAIGYINGVEEAVFSIRTPSEPAAIVLSYDLSNKAISREGKDYIFVYATLVDTRGTICPDNGVKIEFSLDGDAKLIGENPLNSEAGIASILLETHAKMDELIISAKSNKLESSLRIKP